jgi:hypothetical protein
LACATRRCPELDPALAASDRQTAEVDAISIDLVRGLVEGMLDVLARYVPLEREVAALDALFAWQARLVPGIVRL